MRIKQCNDVSLSLLAALLLALSSGGHSIPGYAGPKNQANAELNVSATVVASCSISTSPMAFDTFGPIVANASTSLDVNGSVTTTCTSGSSVTVTLDQGSNLNAGSNDADPLRQMANFPNLPNGTYTDTVIVTVIF